MFDLMVDVYTVAEETVNAEPVPDEDGVLLYANVPAAFVRTSSNKRYLAAGAGIVIDATLALEYRANITDQCEIRNVRSREGVAVAGQPARYRVQAPEPGRRQYHLELDLQAVQ